MDTAAPLTEERRMQFAVAVLLAFVAAGVFVGGLIFGTVTSIIAAAAVALGALFGAVTLAQDARTV